MNPETVSRTDLRDYLEGLLRKRWVALIACAIVVLISAVYATSRTPLYTSVASIEIMEEGKGKTDQKLYTGSEFRELKGYLASQIELLKSRSLAEALVNRLNLLDHPEFNPGTGVMARVLALFDKPLEDSATVKGPVAKLNHVATHILRNVSTKTIKTSNLASVSFTATDPNLATEWLRVYLEIYLAQSLEKRRRESLEASRWLKDELEQAEKKLLESRAELYAFIVDHGIVSGSEGGLGQVLDMINKTMDQHVKSQEQRLKIQALKDQKRPDQGALLLPKDVNTEYVGKLKQQLAQHEAEYTELKGVYDPSYPKMVALQQKIKFLSERIYQIEKGIVTTALDTATKEENLFKESFEKAKGEAEQAKALEARLTLLRLAVGTSEEFHKIIVKEFKEQEIKSRTTASDVRIVDPPSKPHKPSWPKKKLILLIGTLIGVLTGMATAFIADHLDHTVQTPREIERDYNIPQLAIVHDFTRLDKSESSLVAGPPEFLARCAPRSPMADAIRNLQTSIFLSNPDTPMHCIVVSSPSPSQGKTHIAISTAAVLGSEERITVVIDGDMRKPRLHKVFGLDQPGKGFSDFLSSQSLEVADIVRKSSLPGLFFVTAGVASGNPADLLHSVRLRHFVDQVRESFHQVIFDCPPMLGFPDAQLIGLQADGMIMVVKQGAVGRDELSEAIKNASQLNGCRFLGVVFNKAHAAPGSGYYGLGGGYYYKHYSYYHSKT